jgi:NTE family protein
LQFRELDQVHCLHLFDSVSSLLFADQLTFWLGEEGCEIPIRPLPAQAKLSHIIHRLEGRQPFYLLLENSEEYFLQASLLLKSIPSELRTAVKTILLLKQGEAPPREKRPLEATLGTRLHHIIRTMDSRLHLPQDSKLLEPRRGAQFRRIARELAGTRLGLVLSSGGAKGFAYIGVLQVLEELGLEFDVIAGSSIGAVIAALWARGHDASQLGECARKFNKWMHLRRLFDHVMDIRRGLLRGDRLEQYLRGLLDDANFTDLSVPLYISGTDVDNLRSVMFSDGDVASALHASVAIPGICVPCQRDGNTYIDGGVSNPLPVHSLRDRGIENILAVSTVFRARHGIEMRQHREHSEKHKRKNKPFRHRINAELNLFASGNVFDILMRSIETAHGRMVEPEIDMADLVLEPHAPDSRWQEFLQPDKYIDAGLFCAKERMQELQQLELSRMKGTRL